eukprot:2617545-Heterocapsa_arctica.AAC.1
MQTSTTQTIFSARLQTISSSSAGPAESSPAPTTSSAPTTTIRSSSSQQDSTVESSEPPQLALAAAGVEEISIANYDEDDAARLSTSAIEHVESSDDNLDVEFLEAEEAAARLAANPAQSRVSLLRACVEFAQLARLERVAT